MEYTYKYPRPAVTADCIVITREAEPKAASKQEQRDACIDTAEREQARATPKVLLIQRGFDPYKGCWAFPGGFMNMDETTEQCAIRELEEETGLKVTNIHLLPVFYKTISDKQVLRFAYQPFGQETFTLIFHPQFLKEYNGRWFVLYEANREPYQAYNVPLDRIVGEVSEVSDVEYIPAPKGFYQDFFNNITGVTHEKGAKVEEVIIHTKTKYQHGLLLTKPLHHSQKETMPFGEHEAGNYGEVRLTIEPNRELRGRILLYGENLEVISPMSLREQIKEILRRQMQQYSENK